MKYVVRCLSAALIAASLLFMGGRVASAGMELVVVHVVGAALKRGAVIDGTKPLRLEAGWTVTLISSDGKVITLKGPSERAPAADFRQGTGDPRIIEAIGALLSAHERSTASLGVVRSADGVVDVAATSDPWAVNVDRSGPGCVRGDTIVLWRGDASKAATLSISSAGAMRRAEAVWPAGQSQLPLNAHGFRDGASYVVELDGRRIELTLYVAPVALEPEAAQVAWMTQAGCEAQVLALLDKLR